MPNLNRTTWQLHHNIADGVNKIKFSTLLFPGKKPYIQLF